MLIMVCKKKDPETSKEVIQTIVDMVGGGELTCSVSCYSLEKFGDGSKALWKEHLGAVFKLFKRFLHGCDLSTEKEAIDGSVVKDPKSRALKMIDDLDLKGKKIEFCASVSFRIGEAEFGGKAVRYFDKLNFKFSLEDGETGKVLNELPPVSIKLNDPMVDELSKSYRYIDTAEFEKKVKARKEVFKEKSDYLQQSFRANARALKSNFQ